MILAINYADESFSKAQKWNLETALRWGADKVIGYTPKDMDAEFREKNKDILAAKKGNGFYLWKPYFLNKAYKELQDGDYLIYTDAGSIYINKIQYLIDCMEKEEMDIMTFSLEKEMLERKYNKRDAFVLMGCDLPEYANTCLLYTSYKHYHCCYYNKTITAIFCPLFQSYATVLLPFCHADICHCKYKHIN